MGKTDGGSSNDSSVMAKAQMRSYSIPLSYSLRFLVKKFSHYQLEWPRIQHPRPAQGIPLFGRFLRTRSRKHPPPARASGRCHTLDHASEPAVSHPMLYTVVVLREFFNVAVKIICSPHSRRIRALYDGHLDGSTLFLDVPT